LASVTSFSEIDFSEWWKSAILILLNVQANTKFRPSPYKGFRDGGRGEPCVHPLVLRQPPCVCLFLIRQNENWWVEVHRFFSYKKCGIIKQNEASKKETKEVEFNGSISFTCKRVAPGKK
jgi:hypothetical protein